MQRVVIGMAELWCGDCREVLLHLSPDVAIVSDPPYGIAYRHGGRLGHGYAGRKRHANNAPIHGDAEPFDPRHLLGFSQAPIPRRRSPPW